VSLPEHPIINPAFLVEGFPDGGIVLWTRNPHAEYTAYRLNRTGCQIWRRCSGDKPASRIAEEHSTATGCSVAQSLAFLDKLARLGLVVSGGHVRCRASHPRQDKIEAVLWEKLPSAAGRPKS